MTPELWRRVSRLYHDAIAQPPAARDRFVAAASEGDEALRTEVMALLAQPSGDSLARLAAFVPGSSPDSTIAETLDQTLVGRRFGHYQVRGLLGAGGMGRVYRAYDSTLGRDVAIKVLPGAFTADPDRLARFEREARLLAALNHPHVAAIFGIEDADGRRGLVLELVEGETLAERLHRGALPVDDALRIAAAIAEALEAAHEKGIVHRDLKPANIKFGASGTVKVLDFGLAKVTGVNAETDPAMAPTDAAALSMEGLVLGTPAYMSPEQARGEIVDSRTDIWAFGCVLYEMLSGRVAFGGRTPSDAIAAVLDREPDLSALAAATPERVRWILERCLVKDRERRLRDIGDARLEIVDAQGKRDAAGSRTPAKRPEPARWPLAAATGLLGVALAAAGAWILWPTRVPSTPENTGDPELSTPAGLSRITYDDGYVEGPVLSPDGRLIAYASDRAGEDNLDIWLQHVAGGDPIRLTRAADEERQPSFSADGGQILFRSEAGAGGLYTVPTLGGVPRLVVEGGIGGRYSPDGRWIAYWTGGQIGFSNQPGWYRTFVMPATGGEPRQLVGFTAARFPVWSPDSRRLLIVGSRAEVPDQESHDWWVVHLDSNEAIQTRAAQAFRTAGVDPLVPGPSAWVGDRVLASTAGHLWAATLAPAPAFGVAGVQRMTFGPGDASQPASGPDGLVAFVGSTSAQNIWAMPLESETGVARGEPRQLTDGAGPYGRASYSRDRRRLAFQAFRGKWTILIKEMETDRIADLSVAARPFGPVVSPDGTRLVFPSVGAGASLIATQGGAVRRICEDCEPGEWTPDGQSIAWTAQASGLARIQLIEVASGRARPLLEAGEATNRPHFSLDGRWLAFRATDPTRGSEVFVAPFAQDSVALHSTWVSISEARERDARPTGWSPNGRMLYFLSSRDGFRCLYARPWNAEKGQPGGPIQLVRHFHNFRNPGGGGASVISTGAGSAIAADEFIFDYSTTKGDVWTLRIPAAAR